MQAGGGVIVLISAQQRLQDNVSAARFTVSRATLAALTVNCSLMDVCVSLESRGSVPVCKACWLTSAQHKSAS